MTRPRLDWHQIDELLELGQYEKAAKLLYKAQITGKQTGDRAVSDILTAAHQICLACGQTQTAVAWHRKAQAEAGQRELGLKQQLYSMLDLVGRDEPQPKKRPDLWQWTRKLLGRKPDSPSTEQETATESIETPRMPLAWESEAANGELADKAEILPFPVAEKVEIPTPLLAEETGGELVLPVPTKAEPADFSAIQEDISLSAEAEASPPALVKEIDASLQFPLPPDTPRIETLTGEIEMSTAEASGGVFAERPNQRGSPTFVIYCFGPFRVYQDDQPIPEWKSSKGKSIFKYLVVHRQAPVAKEVLMDLLWPDSTADAARNNLNVAIYGLRQTLRQTQPNLAHILFQDECYLLNPELEIWVDVEAFSEHLRLAHHLEQRGELTLAIHEYRAAETLYQGEFLADDRYEDWPVSQRQRLAGDYFSILDRLSSYYLDQKDYDTCAAMCEKMLVVDPCHEQAHFRLMQHYSQRNQRYLALRQYHLCTEALANELNVSPSRTTIELYEQIRRAR